MIIDLEEEVFKDGLQITIDLKKDANSKNILNYLKEYGTSDKL